VHKEVRAEVVPVVMMLCAINSSTWSLRCYDHMKRLLAAYPSSTCSPSHACVNHLL
jgi:hypothetical protein